MKYNITKQLKKSEPFNVYNTFDELIFENKTYKNPSYFLKNNYLYLFDKNGNIIEVYSEEFQEILGEMLINADGIQLKTARIGLFVENNIVYKILINSVGITPFLLINANGFSKILIEKLLDHGAMFIGDEAPSDIKKKFYDSKIKNMKTIFKKQLPYDIITRLSKDY